MLERNPTIYVPHVGEMPAKRADQLEPDDIIVTFAGTELTVVSVEKLEDGKIQVLLVHPVQEDEYYDNKSSHYEIFFPANMFGFKGSLKK